MNKMLQFMLLMENNPLRAQAASHHPSIDYFPIRACLVVFYSLLDLTKKKAFHGIIIASAQYKALSH